MSEAVMSVRRRLEDAHEEANASSGFFSRTHDQSLSDFHEGRAEGYSRALGLLTPERIETGDDLRLMLLQAAQQHIAPALSHPVTGARRFEGVAVALMDAAALIAQIMLVHTNNIAGRNDGEVTTGTH